MAALFSPAELPGLDRAVRPRLVADLPALRRRAVVANPKWKALAGTSAAQSDSSSVAPAFDSAATANVVKLAVSSDVVVVITVTSVTTIQPTVTSFIEILPTLTSTVEATSTLAPITIVSSVHPYQFSSLATAQSSFPPNSSSTNNTSSSITRSVPRTAVKTAIPSGSSLLGSASSSALGSSTSVPGASPSSLGPVDSVVLSSAQASGTGSAGGLSASGTPQVVSTRSNASASGVGIASGSAPVPTSSSLPVFTSTTGSLSFASAASYGSTLLSTSDSSAYVLTSSTLDASSILPASNDSTISAPASVSTGVPSSSASTSDDLFQTTSLTAIIIIIPSSIDSSSVSPEPTLASSIASSVSSSAPLATSSPANSSPLEQILSSSGGATALILPTSSNATSSAASSTASSSVPLDSQLSSALSVASALSASVVSELSAGVTGSTNTSLSPASSLSSAASAASALSVLAQSAVSAAAASSERIFGTSGLRTALLSTNDALIPAAATSYPSSSSHSPSKSTPSAAAGVTQASGGTSAADLFGSIGKSPVAISLTTIISLAVLAVLLGIIAFAVRRLHRNRRRRINGAVLRSPNGDSPRPKWPGADGQNPFLDDGESDVDDTPAAVWARRTSRSSMHGPPPIVLVPGLDGSRSEMTMTPTSSDSPVTQRVVSSDWSSFAGMRDWPEDVENGTRRGSQSSTASIPGMGENLAYLRQGPHPLRNSWVPSPASVDTIPNTPSLYSGTDSPESTHGLVPFTTTAGVPDVREAANPFANYQTLDNAERGLAARPRESWRLSLDRVMGAAADYVGGRLQPQPIVEEDHLTEFSRSSGASSRSALQPPILPDPRNIPDSYRPLSSNYSAQFQFTAPTPTTASQDTFVEDVPPSDAEGRPDLFRSLTFGQNHGGLQRARSGASPPSPSRTHLRPPMAARSASGRSSLVDRRPSGASSSWGDVSSDDEPLPLAPRAPWTTVHPDPGSETDASELSWRVAPSTSRHPSVADAGAGSSNAPPHLFLDPPLPPTPTLFSPDRSFEATQLPPTVLTRAASLRLAASDSDEDEDADDQTATLGTARVVRRSMSLDALATVRQVQRALSGSRATARRVVRAGQQGGAGIREEEGEESPESDQGLMTAEDDHIRELVGERRRKSEGEAIVRTSVPRH